MKKKLICFLGFVRKFTLNVSVLLLISVVSFVPIFVAPLGMSIRFFS